MTSAPTPVRLDEHRARPVLPSTRWSPASEPTMELPWTAPDPWPGSRSTPTLPSGPATAVEWTAAWPPPVSGPVLGSAATPVVHLVAPARSVGGAVLLAMLFGPFGMFYATVSGALAMLAITVMVAIVTFGVGLVLVPPFCMLWAGLAAAGHNRRQAAATDGCHGARR